MNFVLLQSQSQNECASVSQFELLNDIDNDFIINVDIYDLSLYQIFSLNHPKNQHNLVVGFPFTE